MSGILLLGIQMLVSFDTFCSQTRKTLVHRSKIGCLLLEKYELEKILTSDL
jgi:hypothetical protein